MSELLNKLEENKFQKEPITKRKEWVNEITPDLLKEIIDHSLIEEFQNVRNLFERFGFQTEDEEFGFKLFCNKRYYEFGIKPDINTIGEIDRLFFMFYQGFYLDCVGDNLETNISEDIYFSDRELVKEIVKEFLKKYKKDMNEKMTGLIDSANKFMGRMIIDEKIAMPINDYLDVAKLMAAEHLPVVSLIDSHETIDEYRQLLGNLKGILKKKVLIGIVPQLQQQWKKTNSLIYKMKNKEDAMKLDKFLSEFYTEEMKEVIKGKSKEKVMMRVYGLMWKNTFERNPLYRLVEEIMLKLKDKEEQYLIELTEKEKFALISDYNKRDFNPIFCHFGLQKKKEDLSIHLFSFLLGYDFRDKDVNFVEVGFQPNIFDFTDSRRLTKEKFEEGPEYEIFPSDEIVQKWMENFKEILDWFLRR